MTHRRLPIKIDATSNGEFRPIPVSGTVAAANALASERISANARRTGVPRRAFLQSLCGAATTLLTLNQAFAARGNTGGAFVLPDEAEFETAAAAQAIAGDEFIFDVQTHMVDPAGKWRAQRRPVLGADPRALPAGLVRRCRSGRLLLGGSVHQARVHGQRHRPRGAELRARAAREQPALARGGGARARAGRADGGRAPPVPARHGGAERRARDRAAAADGGCGRALPDRGVEVVHAVGARRRRLGAGQPGRRHSVHRAGARARRAQHLHPQRPAVLRLSGGVRALRRRRPGGQALSRT